MRTNLSKTFSSFMLLMAMLNSSMASDLMPAPLMQLDDVFSHHVLVAEKSTHQLHLFQNSNGEPKLLRTFQMATGKKLGDKIFQGDHRTPEGVYQLTEFLTHEDLVKKHGKAGEIYGVGAFVMNYPNPIDRRSGKTGSGIWIHSTNDETRIDKGLDSRGCVVTANVDLIDIAKYIELNRTSIVVVHHLNYLKRDAWQLERSRILSAVNDWVDAWSNEDISRYLSHYSKDDFFDDNRGNFQQFSQYKKAVFQGPGKPQVDILNPSIMMANNYAVVSFVQDYQSSNLADVGKKLLYLKKDEYYNWKIVSEVWTKHGVEDFNNNETRVAFIPSMRFFQTANPENIMEIIPASGRNTAQAVSN